MNEIVTVPERALQSDEIKDLASALVKAQAKIEGAAKTAENPHFRSKYADLGAVWDACRGPLTTNGLAVIQRIRAVENHPRLVTRIVHQTGQWIEDDGIPLLLGKNDMQGLGSALTYARRYGLMAAVGIAPEDDDGSAAGTPADTKHTSKDTTWKGPKTKTDLKNAAAQVMRNLNACEDLDSLNAYLATEEYLSVKTQMQQDMPGWWDHDNGDQKGLKQRVDDRWHFLETEAAMQEPLAQA